MLTQINFAETLHFQGRNGLGICAGIELFTISGMLKLSPVTSKGTIGNCFIEVPIDYLPELIKELQALEELHAVEKRRWQGRGNAE